MPRMEGRVWKKVDYIVVILQSKFTIQKGEDKKVNVKSLYFTSLARKSHHLVLVVQTLDSAIYGINHYPADSVMISVLFIHWIALSNVWTTGAWLTNLRSTVPSSSSGPPYPTWRLLKGTQSIACEPSPPPSSSIFFWVEGVVFHRLRKATRRYKERKGVETKIWGHPWGLNSRLLARQATHQPTALILAFKGTVIQRMQQILR